MAPKANAKIAPVDYPRLLRQLYDREQPPVPVAKEPSVAEMEKVLLAKIPAGAEELRALATRRGIAVQNRLAGKGVSAERMFLVTAGDADDAAESRKNAPEARVDLYLK